MRRTLRGFLFGRFTRYTRLMFAAKRRLRIAISPMSLCGLRLTSLSRKYFSFPHQYLVYRPKKQDQKKAEVHATGTCMRFPEVEEHSAMPIVVVHGVNTRKDEPGYKARQALIASLLGAHIAGATVNGKAVTDTKPDFPYWGDFATSFAWDMASLPTGQIDSLGGAVDPDLRSLVAVICDELGDLRSAQAQPLLTLARKSLPQSVAVLSDALIQNASDHDADRVAAFVASAQAYAEANPNPAWVATVTTDPQFLNRLVTEITGPAPSGL